MKLQHLALGLTLAVAGSAFAATTTHETTVTRVTPHGTVTKHVVRTDDRHHPAKKVVVVNRHHPAKRVVVINNHHRHHAPQKVVIVRPHERHATVTRQVVVRRDS